MGGSVKRSALAFAAGLVAGPLLALLLDRLWHGPRNRRLTYP